MAELTKSDRRQILLRTVGREPTDENANATVGMADLAAAMNGQADVFAGRELEDERPAESRNDDELFAADDE